MKRIGNAISILLALIVLATMASGQVATGTPPFSTISGGPFDAVDLGNLNVNFAIPVVSKPGRGIPFNFSLVYNSSVWGIGTVSGHSAWVPTGGSIFGWQGTGTITPYVTYTVTLSTNHCGSMGQLTYQEATFGTSYTYHDQFGGQHPVSGFSTYFSIYNSPGTASSCPPNGPSPATSQSELASDGSGYTLVLNPPSANSITAQVVDRSGNTITTPTAEVGNSASGAYTVQDANGNQLQFNGSSVFTDTMGASALTISFPQSGGELYSYAMPGGGTAGYTANYAFFPIQTSFGCTGVAEFSNVGKQSTIALLTGITLPDGTSYFFNYEHTPGSSTNYTGRITSITLPTGGQITYTYPGSNHGINCSDGSTMGLTRTLNPGGVWTYTRSLVAGTEWQTKVTSPSDPLNSGTPPAGDDTIIDFQRNSSGNFYEMVRDVYQGSQTTGSLLLATVDCWNGTTTNCATTAVTTPITERAVTTLFPNTGQASKVDTKFNNYGLPTDMKQYAYGASGVPGALARETQIAYATTLGNIADHPQTVTVTDGSGNVLSKTAYGYDEYSTYPLQATTGTPQHVSVTTSRGNTTTITNTVIGTTTLSRHFSYYDTGNVYQVYDINYAVNHALTTYNYSDLTSTCGNTLPTSVTLPISGSTSSTWDCGGGVVTSSADLNGNASNLSYVNPFSHVGDVFWRVQQATDPLNNTTTYLRGTTSFQPEMEFNSNNSVVSTLTNMDGFGRPVLSQTLESPTGTNLDTIVQAYDNFGRPSSTGMPCLAAAGSTCSSADTITVYDALNRVKQRTDGGGGYVQYTYNQNDVLQVVGTAPSGENLKQKELEYDALGRLTKVCELTNGTGSGVCSMQTSSPNGFLTTYAYSVNSSGYPTTTVTQNAQAAGQQTRVYTYDLLGRLVSGTNPETGNFQKSYTYDSDSSGICAGTYSGDLVKYQDPKGNIACHTYDALHRLLTTTYPSGTDSANTPSKTYVYDAATFNGTAMANPKGRMVEAYTGSSTSKITDEFFQYSVRGELTDTWECTPHSGTNGCASVSNYYHVTAGFWANGALHTLSSNISGLPSQTYGVDGMGRTNAVSASSGQNPVTSASYNLSTFTYGVTFGSGDSDTFNLDPNTGRQTKYVFSVNSASDTGQTTWNANGSLGTFQITDNIASTSDTQTCNYTQDDLSRISSVNCVNGATNKWNQQFTYDAFGNITKNSSGPGGVFQPTYSSSTNWITALPGCTPTNDSNGQTTNDCVHNYTWDSEGKMHSVDTTTLTHDALGRMVETASGSTFTQIVYSPMGGKLATMHGQTLVKAFIPLPQNATAVYTPSGLTYYRHTDHLGSSRLATTPTRTLYSSTAYAPYGEPYAQAATTDLSFTGMDQDTVSGIHDFMVRKYPPVQGRWLSPDPAGLAAVDPTTPQSWNRYAYVLNNPLAMVDPTGMSTCDFAGAEVPTSLPAQDCIPDYYTAAYSGGPPPVGSGCITSYCPGAMGGMTFNDPVVPGAELDAAEASYASQVNSIFANQLINKFGAQAFQGNNAVSGLFAVPSGCTSTSEDGSAPTPLDCDSPSTITAAQLKGLIALGLNYFKNHPVFISVNEIVAGQIAVQWSTKTACANLGAGASLPPSKAVTVGVYNNGNMPNWTNVLSSWGYSLGANLIAGYAMSTNSSGTIGGPSISGVGLSGSYTYGGCMSIP